MLQEQKLPCPSQLQQKIQNLKVNLGKKEVKVNFKIHLPEEVVLKQIQIA